MPLVWARFWWPAAQGALAAAVLAGPGARRHAPAPLTPRDTHGQWASISQGPIWQTPAGKAVASAHPEPSLLSTERRETEGKLRGRRVVADVLLKVERECLIFELAA